MTAKPAFYWLLLLILSACQSQPNQSSALEPELIKPDPVINDPDSLWTVIIQGYQWNYPLNPRIEKAIQKFASRPQSLSRQLALGKPFLYHIVQEIKARDLPLELALLPAIESGFRPTAYSRHGAAGLWQFMPKTGLYFGLEQNWWLDERKDLIASTDAALNYLSQLHDRFDGDWLLAIAAYNAGGGTVSRAIKRNQKLNKPTDYWSLDLPRETEEYVPKLLALVHIIARPQQYSLKLPEIANQPQFVKVEIDRPIDLHKASQIIQVEPQQLMSLNASFKQMITHAQGKHYVLLPPDKAEPFYANLNKLTLNQRWHRHQVRAGETLSAIGRRYNIPVSALKQLNRLSSDTIRIGQYLIVPRRNTVQYQVKKGDSLYGIARQFKVKVSDLKKWNHLADERLVPGQKLTLIL